LVKKINFDEVFNILHCLIHELLDFICVFEDGNNRTTVIPLSSSYFIDTFATTADFIIFMHNTTMGNNEGMIFDIFGRFQQSSFTDVLKKSDLFHIQCWLAYVKLHLPSLSFEAYGGLR